MKSVLGGRKGTSLIEILVVMVVLLVGIMTVIQMFPAGFNVVRQAESRTIATRLAQQEIERWKSMAANVPDGLLPVDATADPPTVLNNQMPGPPFDSVTAKSGGGWTLGNARNVRWVLGESTTIPTASYFDSGSGEQYGCRYTLAFSPIAATYNEDTGDVTGIVVKSGDLSRVDRWRNGTMLSHDDDPPNLSGSQYAVAYDDNESGHLYLAFPRSSSRRERIYTVSYSYLAEVDGELLTKSVVNQTVTVPPASDDPDNQNWQEGDWISVRTDWNGDARPEGYIGVDEGSDSCARKFDFLLTSEPWTSDPYEFKVPDYILGVISFNPRARRLTQSGPQGKTPLQVRIDYMISDVRIIREDRIIPAPKTGATTIPIKLALRFILNIGDATDNEDEPKYQGLIRDEQGNVVVAMPMLIIDLATGLRVRLPDNSIDFKNGSVNLPTKANLVDFSDDTHHARVPLAGRNLRFFYRADGDWSIQCAKAFSKYRRKRADETGDPDYRTFKSTNSNTRLLFTQCELGKTVIVDYEYVLNGAWGKVAGRAYRIDKDGANGEVCIDLKPPVGATIPDNARINVVGASFTARAIWRDGKSWRNVDIDTNLMRQQQ